MKKTFALVSLALAAACVAPGAPVGGTQFAGCVSSASPGATEAGLSVLRRGGNAMDAAIAVSLALGVSEPAGSGIGGQAFVLLHKPGLGARVIHGSSRSPRKVPKGLRCDDLVGHKATTVPSQLKVLDLAHRKFGSGKLPWGDLCQPAIALCRDGFRNGPFRETSMRRYGEKVESFLEPDEDGRVRRPRLGKTLQRIAQHGAEDFYKGEIAAVIAADMRKHGGLVTLEDLNSFPEPRIVEPLTGTYRGHVVHTLAPPAGGWVVLRALNILENTTRQQLRAHSTSRTVWMAEALRASHGDRVEDPVQGAEDLDEKVNKASARKVVRERGLKVDGGETTHFCVVDRDGMVVAVTQSLNAYYGAKVAAGEMGFLYNDYMREFVSGADAHPFALRADAEPYSSMSATIVLKDDVPILSVGSPGSRRIISAVVQVVSSVLDAGMSVVDAVAAPRIHVVPEEDQLLLERRPRQPEVLSTLEARGFEVAIPLSSLGRQRRNPYFGGVHAVQRRADGTWVGAADPRRDGATAIAWTSR